MDYTYDEDDYEDEDEEIELSGQSPVADIHIIRNDSVHSVDDDAFHPPEPIDSESPATPTQLPLHHASPSSSSARTRIPRTSLCKTNSSFSPLLPSRRLLAQKQTEEDSIRFVSDRRARSNHKRLPRLTLVTDCCHPHDLDPTSIRYLVLQQYVIQERMLGEREAIRLFHAILKSIVNLHRLNVIHRDLKLGTSFKSLVTHQCPPNKTVYTIYMSFRQYLLISFSQRTDGRTHLLGSAIEVNVLSTDRSTDKIHHIVNRVGSGQWRWIGTRNLSQERHRDKMSLPAGARRPIPLQCPYQPRFTVR